jgi:type III pantothenate kinase
MILLVDVGNSRIKWGLYNGESWVQRGEVPVAEVHLLSESWQELPRPRRVLGCSVGSPEIAGMIRILSMPWGLVPQWLQSSESCMGVVNGYTDPGQLGADRWAALIAARHLHTGSSLVVSAGTALTVDALAASGQYLGGIIVPGVELMLQALAEGTVRIGRRSGRFVSFPTNTADAVMSGVMQALVGAVSRMAGEMKLVLEDSPVCLLSGGNGYLLRPHLNMRVLMVDNLVLEGLARMARE